jgi:hypothetical protein
MKMPDPIIDPTTIIVESKRPRPRIKPDSPRIGGADAADVAVEVFTLTSIFSAGARSLFEKELRPGSRIFRDDQITRHGQRIGAGAENLRGAFQRNAADRDDRLLGMLPRFPQKV